MRSGGLCGAGWRGRHLGPALPAWRDGSAQAWPLVFSVTATPGAGGQPPTERLLKHFPPRRASGSRPRKSPGVCHLHPQLG